MDFQETLTIALPNVEEQLSAFTESAYRKEHGLIVEVAAIHEGMTANYNYYPAAALEGALESWVSPYPKPIIMNHDPSSEPIGRVMAAKMDNEADGTPYTKLQVAITDPEAIAKVLDKRYLTGSVGGKAQEANCSVCGVDWANASMMSLPCRHQRGKTYKGKMAYLEMNKIGFKEYSIVNMPADQRSHVRAIVTANEAEEGVIADDEWVQEARIFDLDMSNERIFEFSESESVNVLEGMKKKEASPRYLQLKGAFLSAMAVAEAEKDDEEDAVEVKKDGPYGKVNYADPGYQSDGKPRYPLDTADHVRAAWNYINQRKNAAKYTPEQVSKIKSRIRSAAKKFGIKLSEESDVTVDNLTPEEDEDILAVAEGLSDDLATVAEEEDEVADQSTDETPAEEDGDKPEGQETPKSSDVDPNTSDGAPKSREEDDETPEEDTDDEEEESSDDEEDDKLSEAPDEEEEAEEEEEENDDEPEESNTDLDETASLRLAKTALESRVAELEASESSLLEKNARLQTALKRNLAERVVDTKIALGLEEGDRDELLTEHMSRNASSLADSLRDMAKMTPLRPTESVDGPPVVEERSAAVSDGEHVVTDGEPEIAEEDDDPVLVAEKVFTDVLMGRRSL